jgi:hypothetical protein
VSGTILVFDPTAPSQNEPRMLGHTVGSLQGRVVGFIDNSKPNFNDLVDDLANLLVARYGVRAVIKRDKRGPAMPAPPAVIDELVAQCDVVITGSGD